MNISYTKKGDYLLPNLTIKKYDYKQILQYYYQGIMQKKAY